MYTYENMCACCGLNRASSGVTSLGRWKFAVSSCTPNDAAVSATPELESVCLHHACAGEVLSNLCIFAYFDASYFVSLTLDP